MKAKSALIATIGTVGIACTANAQDFVGGGGPVNAGPHLFDIVIGASGTIADLDVTTNWTSHGWAGDINASLTHVNTGTTVLLFNNVGGPPVGTPFGDSSDLIGAYRFDDESANNFWTAAASTTGPIPVGTYRASGVGGVFTNLSDFDGQNIQGTWRLSILDTYPAGTPGTLANWTLHMTVPSPGAVALLGLAGLAGGRRRKRV